MFILSLFKSQYNLKATTLFQLLKGKRTLSVLLFGYFNDLLPFLGVMPQLTEQVFQREIDALVNQGFLAVHQSYQITSAGLARLEAEELPQLATLDGYRYQKCQDEGRRLLLFSVQVISEGLHHEKRYLPLETSPFYTQQIRNWLRQVPASGSELLYEEWQSLFLKHSQADLLARQFTGWQTTGASQQQLYPLTAPWHTLQYWNDWHQLFALLSKETTPLLLGLVGATLKNGLNQSMLETRQLLKAAPTATLTELATRRRVKESTIRDHLLELAMLDLLPFYPASIYDEVVAQAKLPMRELDYRQFVTTKEPQDYFWFRLAQIKQKREETKWI
ncbi:hypothetical protein RU97_GL000776 [Enterococcus canis]|uniref:Helicase Helix-turn-helix domain-containing protein n=1 Tax=Enterococcus canis TaxID=214095 RepID=A0A1L8RHM6_9ENTE|nr:hypothetical protein [Enterococcus canis]OJG19205.1 hypothetical protein RU97_GL000776 [Enterococcus canis]